MKRAKRTIVILSLALASCRASVADPTLTPQVFSVRILTTTATAPLLRDLVQAYAPLGTVIAVDSVEADWQAVYEWLRSGDAPFALTTYLPPDAGLWAAPLGQDGIALVVHPANTVPALTVDDLRRIFQGRITSWAALGGPNAPVTVISREAGADTRLAFDALVMGGQPTTPAARLALSSARVVDLVAGDPGAIGYVSMAFVDGRVRAVPVALTSDDQAAAPTPQTVGSGEYPLRTPLLVVGPQPPAETGVYRDWFAWMQSEEGQAVVGQHYAPLGIAELSGMSSES
ncbi:MAG: substrate-binding domain-containing protein [Chloroflexota bacterium]